MMIFDIDEIYIFYFRILHPMEYDMMNYMKSINKYIEISDLRSIMEIYEFNKYGYPI